MIGKCTKPLPAEKSLDLAENRFNWVELRTVWHIPDGHNIEIIVLGLHCPLFMNSEIIHEESKWLVSIVTPQLLQITNKLLWFYGCAVNSDVL